MKKYAILAFYSDFEPFLNRLQSYGAVDISRRKRPLEDSERQLVATISRYTEVIRFFKQRSKKDDVTQKDRELTGEEILTEFDAVTQSQDWLRQSKGVLEKEVAELEVWGEINPSDIERIRGLGITPKFYSCSIKRFLPEWKEVHAIYPLREDKFNVYFVALLEEGEVFSLAAQEMKEPKGSLSQKRDELAILQAKQEENDEKLHNLAAYLPDLEAAKHDLMNQLEYADVKQSAEGVTADKVMMLTAWIPEDQNSELVHFLGTQNVVYLEQAIEEVDTVPIELKNNRFAKLFEPITEMYSLPNYHELDITAFFAPFYMLFFGFCFGDAGYGLILILAGFLFKRKIDKQYYGYIYLIQLLGLATVLFGSFTGSFFGISLGDVENVGWLKRIQPYFFNDSQSLMGLSIGLGAVQVLFGMGVSVAKIIKQQGIKYALSKIAWIVAIIAAVAAFILPMQGVAIPSLVVYVLYGVIGLSALFIYFYNSPGRNPFLNVGLGLWDTFGMATGLLGDLLSYIRLFALGLTGGILGGAFNEMAMTLPPDIPVVGFLIGFLILVLGHSINFLLNMLGALIHPIRLTYVEFFKNAGFEGGGIAYKPFKYNQPKVK